MWSTTVEVRQKTINYALKKKWQRENVYNIWQIDFEPIELEHHLLDFECMSLKVGALPVVIVCIAKYPKADYCRKTMHP